MESSQLKRRLTQTIERAKKQAADRRGRADEAGRAFETFLTATAVPLMRQIANVLKSEGYGFTVFTPSGSVRLMSDRASEDFLEISLETSGAEPQVIVHASRARGRRVDEVEREIGAPASITDEELLDVLLRELEPFVER